MLGMSPIGVGRSYTYPSSNIQNQSIPNSTAPVGQVEAPQTAPVPPVNATAAVQRGTGQSAPPNEPQIPTAREGADPVEMAVRNRIQYLDPEDESLLGTAQAQGEQEDKSPQEIMEESECQTCKNRKYQDGSDDPGVSYQTPTRISSEQAASAVRGHEQEHVVRERAKAQQEGREVVSQSVTIHTNICPECGDVYVSGGTTRTTTRANRMAELFQQEETAPSVFQSVV